MRGGSFPIRWKAFCLSVTGCGPFPIGTTVLTPDSYHSAVVNRINAFRCGVDPKLVHADRSPAELTPFGFSQDECSIGQELPCKSAVVTTSNVLPYHRPIKVETSRTAVYSMKRQLHCRY
jgi:hypothetical protein